MLGCGFLAHEKVDRLGIPDVMVSDGPHGLRKQDIDTVDPNQSIEAVCFPAACATACSFDRELMQSMGETLGEECRAEDVSVLLGPAVNIKRSPLCGRNFEYISEDPYLAGELSAAYINGVQSKNVGTSIKHFAANSQETRRMTCSSDMDERTLREIYFPAFETAVKKAQPWTVMCSYNLINGEYSSENDNLLNKVLRDEWGFKGYVMSDWGAVNDRVKGLAAGLDLEMPSSGGLNDAKIVEAVKNGTLDERILDTAVKRILEQVYRYRDVKGGEHTFDRGIDHKKRQKLPRNVWCFLKMTALSHYRQAEQRSRSSAHLPRTREYRAAAAPTSTPGTSQTHLKAPQSTPKSRMQRAMSAKQTTQTPLFLKRLYSLPQTAM